MSTTCGTSERAKYDDASQGSCEFVNRCSSAPGLLALPAYPRRAHTILDLTTTPIVERDRGVDGMSVVSSAVRQPGCLVSIRDPSKSCTMHFYAPGSRRTGNQDSRDANTHNLAQITRGVARRGRGGRRGTVLQARCAFLKEALGERPPIIGSAGPEHTSHIFSCPVDPRR